MGNDLQIQQAVLRKLGEEHIGVGTVGVEVHHGVVKLAGRLPDYAKKTVAELAAHRVEGVTNVINDIDVTGVGIARRRLATVHSK